MKMFQYKQKKKIQTEKNLQTEDISNETEIFCQTEIIMNDTCEDHNNEKTEGQAIPTVEEASENRTESTGNVTAHDMDKTEFEEQTKTILLLYRSNTAPI